MTESDETGDQTPAALISQRIATLSDWRGDMLRRVREPIHEADPDIVEEWSRGTPVRSHAGIVCTGERRDGRQADLPERCVAR